MNELLAQFAEQAAEHAVLNPSESVLQSEVEDRKVEIPAEFISKFAESILAECIDIAEQTRFEGKVVAERIKFVFGVDQQDK